MSKLKADKNFAEIIKAFHRPNISGICLEGSSGSGKTWAAIKFLLWFGTYHSGNTINIIRETYNSFKTTLYDDFGRILQALPVDNPFITHKDISTYRYLENKINFLGADDPAKFEGNRCDIAYYNEMLDIDKVIFNQQSQRTRRFFIADWNPKTTDHWAFELEKRKDIVFVRSTFHDNISLSDQERQTILGYEPTPENIDRGTADEYRWKVYGLGERAARQGLVHPNVTWISEFPPDNELDKIGYGLDFGFTNSPTAIVKVGRKGNNLYVKLLYYQPIADSNKLIEVVSTLIPKDAHITCDSSDKASNEAVGFIVLMRRAGINAIPCRKFPGSIKFGIDNINKHCLHYVRDVDLRKEQENRVWRYVGGIPLNEPEPGFDHAHDAIAYCLQTDFQN